jgi:hypothetical protein
MTVHSPPASTPTGEQVVQGSDGSAPAPGQGPPSLPKPGQEVSLTGSVATKQPGPYKEPAPKPGVPILPPVWPPQPGQVIVGWKGPEPGCCQCDGLSPQGLASVIILAVIFTPLAWSKFSEQFVVVIRIPFNTFFQHYYKFVK